jgi:hypothetical protein
VQNLSPLALRVPGRRVPGPRVITRGPGNVPGPGTFWYSTPGDAGTRNILPAYPLLRALLWQGSALVYAGKTYTKTLFLRRLWYRITKVYLNI